MTLMIREIKEAAGVIPSCAKNNAEKIAQLIDLLNKNKPKCVVLAARGTSDHAGFFAKYLIETYVGVPVVQASPSVYTVYDGKMDLKDTLVLAVSQSGKAADVLEIVKKGNACGAVTVCITNDENSPMAKEGKFHLFCSAGEEKSVAATKTFIAQLYLCTMIAGQWSGDKNILDAAANAAEAINKTYELEDYIENLVKRYRFITDGFVLARGLSFPLALEAALKIQETCYIKARGYAISDFHHGPFAMVAKDTPVVVFAVDGNVSNDTLEMIEKLKNAEADILMISNDKEFADMGSASILLPSDADGILGVFAGAIAIQMFACKLSVSRGLNPDAPRGLKKVTITK